LSQLAQANLTPAAQSAAAAAWVTANDVNKVSDPQQLLRLNTALNATADHGANFAIAWTGSVKAPYDGDYTFSISPVNANSDEPGLPVRQRMTVSIAGQQVIHADEKSWTPDSQAVSLKAGVATPLRVEFSFVYARKSRYLFANHAPAARLLWQGPGTSKQLVPASAFFSADGTQPGLSAEYRLTPIGQDQPSQTVTRTEPMINRLWLQRAVRVLPYPELSGKLGSRVAALAIAPDYLDQLVANPSTPHFLLQLELTSVLTCEQMAAMAEEVTARPAILGATPGRGIFGMYAVSRICAPDTALRLCGKAAQTHPQAEPRFSLDFQKDGNDNFFLVGWAFARAYPAHLDLMERNYLAMPDGSCSLPIAYDLSYAYAILARTEEWLAKLDARLQDKTIQGDARISWLIARAWSEELRGGGARGYLAPKHSILAGRGWLDEACLTAQSEPVRLQAYKELLVRLSGTEQFDAARDLLKKATGQCSLPDSATKLALWGQQIDALAEGFAQLHAKQTADSQQAYWTEVRARRQKAVDAGDKAVVSRYEKMMSDAGITP